jgi:hypothetical protein
VIPQTPRADGFRRTISLLLLEAEPEFHMFAFEDDLGVLVERAEDGKGSIIDFQSSSASKV